MSFKKEEKERKGGRVDWDVVQSESRDRSSYWKEQKVYFKKQKLRPQATAQWLNIQETVGSTSSTTPRNK